MMKKAFLWSAARWKGSAQTWKDLYNGNIKYLDDADKQNKPA